MQLHFSVILTDTKKRAFDSPLKTFRMIWFGKSASHSWTTLDIVTEQRNDMR